MATATNGAAPPADDVWTQHTDGDGDVWYTHSSRSDAVWELPADAERVAADGGVWARCSDAEDVWWVSESSQEVVWTLPNVAPVSNGAAAGASVDGGDGAATAEVEWTQHGDGDGDVWFTCDGLADAVWQLPEDAVRVRACGDVWQRCSDGEDVWWVAQATQEVVWELPTPSPGAAAAASGGGGGEGAGGGDGADGAPPEPVAARPSTPKLAPQLSSSSASSATSVSSKPQPRRQSSASPVSSVGKPPASTKPRRPSAVGRLVVLPTAPPSPPRATGSPTATPPSTTPTSTRTASPSACGRPRVARGVPPPVAPLAVAASPKGRGGKRSSPRRTAAAAKPTVTTSHLRLVSRQIEATAQQLQSPSSRGLKRPPSFSRPRSISRPMPAPPAPPGTGTRFTRAGVARAASLSSSALPPSVARAKTTTPLRRSHSARDRSRRASMQLQALHSEVGAAVATAVAVDSDGVPVVEVEAGAGAGAGVSHGDGASGGGGASAATKLRGWATARMSIKKLLAVNAIAASTASSAAARSASPARRMSATWNPAIRAKPTQPTSHARRKTLLALPRSGPATVAWRNQVGMSNPLVEAEAARERVLANAEAKAKKKVSSPFFAKTGTLSASAKVQQEASKAAAEAAKAAGPRRRRSSKVSAEQVLTARSFVGASKARAAVMRGGRGRRKTLRAAT